MFLTTCFGLLYPVGHSVTCSSISLSTHLRSVHPPLFLSVSLSVHPFIFPLFDPSYFLTICPLSPFDYPIPHTHSLTACIVASITSWCNRCRWYGSACHWSRACKYRHTSWHNPDMWRHWYRGLRHIRLCHSGSAFLQIQPHNYRCMNRLGLGRFPHSDMDLKQRKMKKGLKVWVLKHWTKLCNSEKKKHFVLKLRWDGVHKPQEQPQLQTTTLPLSSGELVTLARALRQIFGFERVSAIFP